MKRIFLAIIALAIIAVALFVVLSLAIFAPIIALAKANPTYEASSLLGSQIGALGSLKTTMVVSFEPGTDLSGSALAEKVALGKNQICMSTGEFPTDAEKGFECLGCGSAGAPQQRIIYHGTANINAKIAVVCDKWLGKGSGLATELKNYTLDAGAGSPNIVDSCANICKEKSTCCAIVLKKA